jgi:methionine-S-sulfoxide reductase
MKTKTAIFAGGCFWCVEDAFLPGTPEAREATANIPKIIDIESGYTGGEERYANYQDHKYHGHREAVRVTYDSKTTNFKELVKYFFTKHDPTDAEGSFHDRGFSYSPAIYYETESERDDINKVIAELEEMQLFDGPIVTAVEPRKPFYIAEDYHQRYSQKNPIHYQVYASASGRKDFQKALEHIFDKG